MICQHWVPACGFSFHFLFFFNWKGVLHTVCVIRIFPSPNFSQILLPLLKKKKKRSVLLFKIPPRCMNMSMCECRCLWRPETSDPWSWVTDGYELPDVPFPMPLFMSFMASSKGFIWGPGHQFCGFLFVEVLVLLSLFDWVFVWLFFCCFGFLRQVLM